MPCDVRVGGFGGKAGLLSYLREREVELLLDATHPYAAEISRHAHWAAKQVACPVWALRRPPWKPRADSEWLEVADWKGILRAIEPFRTVFFSVGRAPLDCWGDRQTDQRWIVRSLAPGPDLEGIQVLVARGPFSVASESAILVEHGVDVLVSKNSGGSAVSAKIEAARGLRLPVVMLRRPAAVPFDREFVAVDEMRDALTDWIATR